jgi:hypothetical protein
MAVEDDLQEILDSLPQLEAIIDEGRLICDYADSVDELDRQLYKIKDKITQTEDTICHQDLSMIKIKRSKRW